MADPAVGSAIAEALFDDLEEPERTLGKKLYKLDKPGEADMAKFPDAAVEAMERSARRAKGMTRAIMEYFVAKSGAGGEES